MKKVEVTKMLNDGFKTILFTKGFKKWKFGFVRNTDNNAYYSFGFSSASYDNCFPTTFYFGIGLNNLRKILIKVYPEMFMMPENQFPTILSIGQKELFESNKYPVFKYEIYSEEDVTKMISEVSNYFIDEALPYLESISSIENLEQITNRELNPWKKSIGLILARLVNNPEYSTLKDKYRLLLSEWSDFDKKELERVINFLDSHSYEELLEIAGA